MCYLLHQAAVCRVSAPAHTLSEGVPVFADCQLIYTRHNYALWMPLKTYFFMGLLLHGDHLRLLRKLTDETT